MKFKPIRIYSICLLLLTALLTSSSAQTPPKQPDLGPELFMAIGKNDLMEVQSLLKKGADPNARNFLSFTPLHWAAMCGHAPIAESLLAGGSKLEAESPFGTALTFALEGNHPKVIKLLLARNANVAASRPDGITSLMLAAGNGDIEIQKQILHKRVKVNAQDKSGQTALMYAVRAGQLNTARQLIEAGASLSVEENQKWTALTYAVANGRPQIVTFLANRGADVNHKDRMGRTPLMVAALYGRQPEVIRTLLSRGANKEARDNQGRTALLLAWARNDSACIQAFSTTKSAVKLSRMPALVTPQVAIARSLTLLQQTNANFTSRAGCISCHHEGLGLMATAVAKERGYTINTAQAQETQKRIYTDQTQHYPLILKALSEPEIAKHLPGIEINELTPALSFILSGLVSHHWPADEKLAAITQVLARQQAKGGHWQFIMPRVPMQSSPFTMTALSLRILQAYMPETQSVEKNERIARARQWLLQTPAQNTEDKTFRLLGLLWSGADREARQAGVAELRASQRSDGGWAQLAGMRSDAYATGQALYALHEAGSVATTDPAWQRGLRFLLQTQDEDGSWYVNKRALPANNYLDVGFPHGSSQYVSYAATCWAMMALTQAGGPAESTASLKTR